MSEVKHLVDVRDLRQYFTVKSGMLNKLQLKAVDGVSFSIDEGETLGLVGESGCGKTTVGRTILHLYKPTSGEVWFDGRQVTEKNIGDFRKDMQIVFQDPYSSLDPRMYVGKLIAEALKSRNPGRKESEAKVKEVMDTVGIAQRLYYSYPHELDGGLRQRVVIARALALDPKFIVCDEPVSALDVSIQAQVLNLLMDLQEERNLTFLFITHDLALLPRIAHRVAVMYDGKIVEEGDAATFRERAASDYAKALLAADFFRLTKI